MDDRRNEIEVIFNNTVHEINVAHGMECNEQARYHIKKQFQILSNKYYEKWNELGVWMCNNPDASVADVQKIRAKIYGGIYARENEIPTRKGE
jgi:hypothetical protein